MNPETISPNIVNGPTNQAEAPKKCEHMPIIIVLIILAVIGFGFGGFELWQNIQKDEKISNLENVSKEVSLSDDVRETETKTGEITNINALFSNRTLFNTTSGNRKILAVIKEQTGLDFYVLDNINAQKYGCISDQTGTMCIIDNANRDAAQDIKAKEQPSFTYQCVNSDCDSKMSKNLNQLTWLSEYGLVSVKDGEETVIIDGVEGKIAYHGKEPSWVTRDPLTNRALYFYETIGTYDLK